MRRISIVFSTLRPQFAWENILEAVHKRQNHNFERIPPNSDRRSYLAASFTRHPLPSHLVQRGGDIRRPGAGCLTRGRTPFPSQAGHGSSLTLMPFMLHFGLCFERLAMAAALVDEVCLRTGSLVQAIASW